jgi:hypothetical protein
VMTKRQQRAAAAVAAAARGREREVATEHASSLSLLH